MAKVLKTGNMQRCIGCLSCELVCAAGNRKSHSFSKSAIKIRAYGGVGYKFTETVCHACKEAPCAEVCPADALVPRKGGGVTLKKDKCIGCRMCIPACSVGAVFFDDDTNLPIICSHCGLCTRHCPHKCLQMAEVEVDK